VPGPGGAHGGQLFTHQWPSGARIGIRVGRDTVTLIDTGEDGSPIDQRVGLLGDHALAIGRFPLSLWPTIARAGSAPWALGLPGMLRPQLSSDLELMTHRGEMRAVVEAASIRWRSILTPDIS
jgi:hypothetical protein